MAFSQPTTPGELSERIVSVLVNLVSLSYDDCTYRCSLYVADEHPTRIVAVLTLVPWLCRRRRFKPKNPM